MIIKLTNDIARTCFALQRKSGKAFNCDKVTVEIAQRVSPSHAQRCQERQQPHDNCGCNTQFDAIYHDCCEPCHKCDDCEPVIPYEPCGCEDIGPVIPLLRYVTSITDDGKVCIDWDNAIFALPNRRYVAIIYCNGTCISHFDIELICDPVEVGDVTETEEIGACDA